MALGWIMALNTLRQQLKTQLNILKWKSQLPDQPNRGCVSVHEDKTEGRKAHKQEATDSTDSRLQVVDLLPQSYFQPDRLIHSIIYRIITEKQMRI